MKRSSWVSLGIICVIAVTLACAGVNRKAPPDAAQIYSALEDGRRAVERKDIRTLMSFVSPSYSDSTGTNFDRLRMYLIRSFRSEDRYKVTLIDPSMKPASDTMLVQVRIIVSTTDAGQETPVFDGPLNITFRKEHSRRWLVIPETKWKVIGCTGLPSGIDD
jgi:hypothetical protein